jgi:hypothetical protein
MTTTAQLTIKPRITIYINYLRTASDFCHQGWDTEIAQKFKIVETYWHNHSLESSSGALSDGAISFFIQSFGEMHFQKPSELR